LTARHFVLAQLACERGEMFGVERLEQRDGLQQLDSVHGSSDGITLSSADMRTLLALVAVTACSAGPTAEPGPRRLVVPRPNVPDRPAAKPEVAMTLAQSGIVPEWIDRGADPCQDFFAYSCGGFTKTAQIPPDRSSWGAIQIVTKDNEEFLRKVLETATGQ